MSKLFKLGNSVCLNYPGCVRQGQQSQVERLKSEEDVALPRQRQRCCPPPKVCFCLLGRVGGGCPEGWGTWNIKPCHGSSAQLWALSRSGSLSGVEVAGGVAQVWKRFLSSLLFTLLGHTTPLRVQAGGNVYVTLLLKVTDTTEGKVGLCGVCLTVFIRRAVEELFSAPENWA